ncbi:MAG: S-methyl-5-thioribose-1-phosphate isomerase [Chloroflexi bacterium]|nr:S-methyl-5-thioribose-1-phosphate isomerase [Chloroflexota bacterium]
MRDIQPVRWQDGHLLLLDQTLLPHREVVLEITDHRQAAEAIRQMRVRGAPAIGVAGAYAVALAARALQSRQWDGFLAELEREAAAIGSTRPTAVNLRWAVDRMLRRALQCASSAEACHALEEEACRIHQEDVEACRALSAHGASLLPSEGGVLTHCNAGALATGGYYGTALGVVRAAWEMGKRFHAFCTETRPFLQGARLTAWELVQMGIPATLVVDSAAGSLMRKGEVQCVIVGADRIAANGDVANKIGTYSLAVLARENAVPFYVAAPTSTVDLSLPSGEEIPIEERPAEEVTRWASVPTAPAGIGARNPAFDVTPHRYVTAIITERGVLCPPYEAALRGALADHVRA